MKTSTVVLVGVAAVVVVVLVMRTSAPKPVTTAEQAGKFAGGLFGSVANWWNANYEWG